MQLAHNTRNFIAMLLGITALIILAVTASPLQSIDPTPRGLGLKFMLTHIYYILWLGVTIAMALAIQGWRQGESRLFSMLNLLMLLATFAVNSEFVIHIMGGSIFE